MCIYNYEITIIAHNYFALLVLYSLTDNSSSFLSGVVFLDFRKAFDLVNHDLLIKKISLYTNSAATFFKSYLDDRTQKVLLNGTYSNHRLVKHGVPKGSILGPLLFCLFINDLPLTISDHNVQCYMFADAAAIHTPDEDLSIIDTRLQNALQDIDRRLNVWYLVPVKSTSSALSLTQLVSSRKTHQPSNRTLSSRCYCR